MTTNTSNAEPLLTTEQFRKALGYAGAQWNLTQFAAVQGWPVDDYAREKFRKFQDVAHFMNNCDSFTLRRIVEASLTQRES